MTKAKILGNFSRLILGVIPTLAMLLALHSVSATCSYVLHQPDVPGELL